ncbi:hypothetical protein PBY51_009771 [Eleginops maclovinus]|uniref:Uncharacterized protein n=1 Tax=Eleginops maclovinus TaxID=56733 RepID=A0AAN7XWW3_ELEMC|nr:hypothetical protein PBY51_009771 [Eleginops maclovinus]
MSHFPLFIQRYINMEEQREYMDFVSPSLVSLIEIPASAALEQPLPGGAPPGPCRVSWRREHPFGTVPTQTGISQGMGDWHVPKSPQQCSEPAPSGKLPSFIVCYS